MMRAPSFVAVAVGLAAAGLVLVPRDVRACSVGPCERLVDVGPAFSGPVPSADGAIALRPVLGPYGYFDAMALGERVTVTVTPTQGGAPVPGVVVGIEEVALLVWRPDAPLSPLTEYTVHVAVDNTMLAYPDCAEDSYERMWTVGTSDVDPLALAVPAVTPSAMAGIDPVLRLDSMVCCDGAFPVDAGDTCEAESVTWTDGICAAGVGYGKFEATLALDPAVVAAGQGRVAYHYAQVIFAPGAEEASFAAYQPICGPLTAIHLKTGEVMNGPEVCVGQDLEDMLGLQPVDPGPGLTMCAGDPYTCEVVDGAPLGPHWDSLNCTTWPDGQPVTTGAEPTGSGGSDGGTGATAGGSGSSGDGEASGASEASAGGSGGEQGDKGCACAAGGGAPQRAAWWAAGLVLLARRRRLTRP